MSTVLPAADVDVRDADEGDLPSLCHTLAAARLSGLSGMIDVDAEPTLGQWALHVGGLLDDPSVHVLAAVVPDGGVVGMAAAHLEGGGLHLAVHPRWHGRGVAGPLAGRWELALARGGCRPSTLVWSGDRRTMALLTGRGWQATHEVHQRLAHGTARTPGGRVLLTRLVR